MIGAASAVRVLITPGEMRVKQFLKPPRFSLRTLLIATAVIGLLLSVVEWRVLRPYRTAIELSRMPGVSLLLAKYEKRGYDSSDIEAHQADLVSPWTYFTDSIYQVYIQRFDENDQKSDPATLGRLLRDLPRLRRLTIGGGDRNFYRALGPGISNEWLEIIGNVDCEEAVLAVSKCRAVDVFFLGGKLTPESLRPLNGSSVKVLHLQATGGVEGAYSVDEVLKIREVIPEIAVEVY